MKNIFKHFVLVMCAAILPALGSGKKPVPPQWPAGVPKPAQTPSSSGARTQPPTPPEWLVAAQQPSPSATPSAAPTMVGGVPIPPQPLRPAQPPAPTSKFEAAFVSSEEQTYDPQVWEKTVAEFQTRGTAQPSPKPSTPVTTSQEKATRKAALQSALRQRRPSALEKEINKEIAQAQQNINVNLLHNYLDAQKYLQALLFASRLVTELKKSPIVYAQNYADTIGRALLRIKIALPTRAQAAQRLIAKLIELKLLPTDFEQTVGATAQAEQKRRAATSVSLPTSAASRLDDAAALKAIDFEIAKILQQHYVGQLNTFVEKKQSMKALLLATRMINELKKKVPADYYIPNYGQTIHKNLTLIGAQLDDDAKVKPLKDKLLNAGIIGAVHTARATTQAEQKRRASTSVVAAPSTATVRRPSSTLSASTYPINMQLSADESLSTEDKERIANEMFKNWPTNTQAKKGTPQFQLMINFRELVGILKGSQTRIKKAIAKMNLPPEEQEGLPAQDSLQSGIQALIRNTNKTVPYLSNQNIELDKRKQVLDMLLQYFKEDEKMLPEDGKKLYEQLNGMNLQ